jgi:hypothetical protein
MTVLNGYPLRMTTSGVVATLAEKTLLTDYGWQCKLVCVDGKRSAVLEREGDEDGPN